MPTLEDALSVLEARGYGVMVEYRNGDWIVHVEAERPTGVVRTEYCDASIEVLVARLMVSVE